MTSDSEKDNTNVTHNIQLSTVLNVIPTMNCDVGVFLSFINLLIIFFGFVMTTFDTDPDRI